MTTQPTQGIQPLAVATKPKRRTRMFLFKSAHKTRAGAEKRVTELRSRGHSTIVREKKVGMFKYRVWEKVPSAPKGNIVMGWELRSTLSDTLDTKYNPSRRR